MLAGLRIATDLGIKKIIVRGDSQLVVKQVNKDYQSPLMEAYVMTHKYRGSIIVLSISKSVEPYEEQQEMTRSFQ